MGKKQGFTIIEVVVAMVLLAMAGVIAAVCVRTAGSLRAEESKYQRADEEMVLQDSEVRKLLERQEMSWTYMQLKDAAGNNVGSGVYKGAWGDKLDSSDRTMPGVNVPWLAMPNEAALYGETGGQAAAVPEEALLTRALPTHGAPDPDQTKDVLPAAARPLPGDTAAGVPAVEVTESGDHAYFVPAKGFGTIATLPEDTICHAEVTETLAPDAGVVSTSEQAWAAWLHAGVSLAPGSALTLGEEFLWLEGGVSAVYSPGETCGQLTLVALSGGDQPTLVYLPQDMPITVTQYVAVEAQQAQGALEGTLDAARGAPAEGLEAPLADAVPGEGLVPVVYAVTWSAGWYAVPPGTELTGLAVAYNGQDAADEATDFAKLLKSWSLDEALLAQEAEKLPTPEEREAAGDAARQALDSAWARLMLARVLTQDDLNQTA